jgi:hypothetical protein
MTVLFLLCCNANVLAVFPVIYSGYPVLDQAEDVVCVEYSRDCSFKCLSVSCR